MTPFVIYQGAWNVLERDFEREIIPTARNEDSSNLLDNVATFTNYPPSLGMALAPWNILAAGKFRTDAEEEERHKTGEYRKMRGEWERNEDEKRISAMLEKVAHEVGTKHLTAGEQTPFHPVDTEILTFVIV
jgi:aryl-alcohol dehydrogenase-like predicted oxidoreductase